MTYSWHDLNFEPALQSILFCECDHILYPISSYHVTILALLARDKRDGQFGRIIQSDDHGERNLRCRQPFLFVGHDILLLDCL